jgi:hypothetical protein
MAAVSLILPGWTATRALTVGMRRHMTSARFTKNRDQRARASGDV